MGRQANDGDSSKYRTRNRVQFVVLHGEVRLISVFG